MLRNVARMRDHLDSLGVALRAHLKTVKSVDAAQRIWGNAPPGPATVSTLKEAEVFSEAGVHDIVYAVGIVPHKLPRVAALRARGCDLAVILDSVPQAEAVAAASRDWGQRIPALIEIDSDGQRSGLAPDDPRIVEVGRILVSGGAELRGVLTHAGGSYSGHGADAGEAFAEQERRAAVTAADQLREVELPCPVVSVGSTPTAHFARDLTGVTEVRAGVYPFQDLVMTGIGVCGFDDIAISVLTTVIGHQHDRNWILIDAGWMALSRDRGTAAQAMDHGYGVVCDIDGHVFPDLIVQGTSQEHGIISTRPGTSALLPNLSVGTCVRILPNHACATAAQFDWYDVIPFAGNTLERWPRFRGW